MSTVIKVNPPEGDGTLALTSQIPDVEEDINALTNRVGDVENDVDTVMQNLPKVIILN